MFRDSFLKKGTLVLSKEGLRLGGKTYRWQDIDRFGVMRDWSLFPIITGHQCIYWLYHDVKDSGEHNQEPSAELKDMTISSFCYRLRPNKFASLLNSWLQEQTRRTTTIQYGPETESQRFRQSVDAFTNIAWVSIVALYLILHLRHC